MIIPCMLVIFTHQFVPFTINPEGKLNKDGWHVAASSHLSPNPK